MVCVLTTLWFVATYMFLNDFCCEYADLPWKAVKKCRKLLFLAVTKLTYPGPLADDSAGRVVCRISLQL